MGLSRHTLILSYWPNMFRPAHHNLTIRTATTVLLCIAGSALAVPGTAAEIQLKSKTVVAGNLIMLKDVATIFENDPQMADRMAQTELGPAPLGDQQISLTVVDIQRTLLHRGVDLSRHRFSGAAKVVVASESVAAIKPIQLATSRAPLAPRAMPLNSEAMRQAEDKLKSAIQAFLTNTVSATHAWNVTLRCNADGMRLALECEACRVSGDAQSRTHVASVAAYSETGGYSNPHADAPTHWLGTQIFPVVFESPNGQQISQITAVISQTPSVVVLAAAVSKGTILQREHLQLQRGTQAASGDAFHQIEDVIGQESTQNMAPGQILDTGLVRSPELVRRGEIVSVIVHSSGVRLRMEGRARDTGRKGDTVLVESLSDRSVFTARVRDLQTVEVLARSTSLAERPTQGNSPNGWTR